MGARMSTETFWRHLQVKQLYSWIKSLPLRGEMVCLSHTLWSGRPLTRRMRALFHRTMGLYLLILPDLTHHLSLTGGKDSRVSLDVILCPSLQCFHHASLSICQWTDTHQMAGGRGYSCTICVRPLLWSHAYWGSQRVWWFGFEPGYNILQQSEQKSRLKETENQKQNRKKLLFDTPPWTPFANDTTHQMGEFANQS